MCSSGNKKQASAYFYSDSEEEIAHELISFNLQPDVLNFYFRDVHYGALD